jgi:hypothetical protein
MKNRQRTLRIAVSLGLLLAALAPRAARAQDSAGADAAGTEDREQARKHFAQGLKLYNDGDFDAALVQFERAYSVKANFKVLYNMAQCYFELRQYVDARDTLARYLKEGEGHIEAERQQQVEKALSELQRRVARLKLRVNVKGATVYVDGKKAGITPLAGPVDVNEGQRTISVETADRGTKQRVVRLAGGEEQAVTLDFDSVSAPSPSNASAESARSTPRPNNGLPTGFWVSGIGALALGAFAGVTGYLALSAQHDHDQELKRFGVTPSELEDSRDRAKTLAITTDLLAGGALVCAGIAAVILVTDDSGSQQVGATVGPGSLKLHGSF